jgi:hypothetical protein
MNAITITAPGDLVVEIALAEHAAVIRALGKRVIGDVIEIGRRLTDAKSKCQRGDYTPWLAREFGWTDSTALNFTQVHAMVGKTGIIPDLSLSVTGLYLLAQPSTPQDARDDVIARAENGETLSVADVQRIVDEATFKQHDKLVAEMAVKAKIAEDAIRAEYDGKLVVDPEKLQADIKAAIDKALKPLQRNLKAAEKKLAAAEKRLVEETTDDAETDIEEKTHDEHPENYRSAFLIRADQAVQFAAYSGPNNYKTELAVTARQVAAAWTKLAENLECEDA